MGNKIIIALYTLKRLRVLFRIFILNLNSNINISYKAYIHKRAIIEIKYGGNIKIGSYTEILENVIIQTYGGTIKIGDHCSINANCILYGHGGLTIGNDVLIAGGTMIIPNNHKFEKLQIPIRMQGCSSKGIYIENNVWIGHGCSILDGIRIKKNCILGAGTVLTKDTIENGIYVGVPSRLLKIRTNE